MQSKLNPYLSFKNNARQAMEFYKSVFGGNLQLRTFKEFHASQTPEEDNLIMHAELNAGEVLTNINMSLTGDNVSELKTYFQKLSDGGKVSMPLKTEVWGDTFGMCTDQFGVGWMVNINAKKS